MPRLTHAVPRYCKHRSSGQAVVTLHGHDHYSGPHGSKTSIAEYDRLIGEYLASSRRKPVGRKADCLVKDVLLAYWKHVQTYNVKNGNRHRGFCFCEWSACW